MTEDGLLHTAELLRTALPYVDIRLRLALELLVKLYELIICIQNFRNNDISACGFENKEADMEALLNNIRTICNENERTFVDKMLQIFQAKRMFEMYNTYMETMNFMQDVEGFEGFDNNDNYDNKDNEKVNDNCDYKNNEYVSNDYDNNDYSNNDYNNKNYVKMFEELKSMITPDQMQTYENLRMLFSPTSYDDNNNNSDCKE